MAGLLDLFGSSGTDSLGLLGMSQEDIKRARDDAQAQAMYALAGRLFQGGNTGQSIAQGLQMGQQAYKQAMNEQLGDKLQTMKLQDMLRQQQEAQEIKRRQAAVENIIGQAYRPAQTTYEQLTPQQMEQAAAGQRVVGQTTTPARFDIQSAAPVLMALPEGRKALTDILSAQKAMAGESFKLGEGERQFTRDPFTGELKQVATGGEKAKSLKEVDLGSHIALLDPNTGAEVMRFPKGRAPEGPVSLQHVETEQGLATFNPRTGQLTPVMQGDQQVQGKGAKATESERNAAGFATRMTAANQIAGQFASAAPGFGSAVAGAVPFVGDSLKNLAQKPETQQYAQAAKDWIRAKLRKESGAAIGVEEEANEFKTYFPQVGDSAAVIRQKAEARDRATQAMVQSAGGAMKGSSIIKKPTISGW